MKKLFTLGAVGSALALPVMSYAAGMADLFTAADISPLATNVSTLLVAFIGVSLLFLGYRYIRKSGVR